MTEPTFTQPGVLRTVRIVHGVMLCAVFLNAFTAEWLHSTLTNGSPGMVMLAALAGVAVLEAVMALNFRAKVSGATREILREKPNDQAALKRWQNGSVLVSVLCLCVGLYGLVLRFMGFRFSQCLPFYVAAGILMLICWPRLD